MNGRRTASIALTAMTVLLFACASSPNEPPKLAWHVGAEWTRVAQLEDGRTTNDGELVRLLASDDAALRARLATALGRMPFPDEGADVTRALLGVLFDADANVRAAAAFALGMRGDASAADKLLFVALDYHEADADALVRARALEAASKLDRPELRERMLDGLLDSDPRVRVEAAEGASRWATSDANASAVNQRLVDALANEKDRDVIVYTLFALERRKAKEAIDVFLGFAKSDDSTQRLFAVRGLKTSSSDPKALNALCEAAENPGWGSLSCDRNAIGMVVLDAYWRIACEAKQALGASDAPRAREALMGMLLRNPHVERCAWESLGAQLERSGDLSSVPLTSESNSSSVRAAQLEALARGISKRLASIEPPSVLDQPLEPRARADADDALLREAYAQLQRGLVSDDEVIRTGVARAAAHFPDNHALPWLGRLAHDPSPTVAGAALEGFGKHPSDATRLLLHGFLAHPDNGLRLAAVTALAEMPDASDLAPLKRCFDSSTGDGAVEIRFNVLRDVAKVGDKDALAILVAAFADPAPFVRKVAREELARARSDVQVTEIDVPIARPAPAEVPLPGAEFPEYAANPRVEVVTSRGSMVFELFPQEAPAHVHNFLTLAARDYYDGLTFHRVVPDFVIQGGDYRGDGNGGGTWRGRDDSLRHEITPRKYVRGSLGMPRNEDFDSGGSQFFVTHRPTPHLDGRYTIFGELREGFEVLDAIEVGDKILDVHLLR